MLSNIYFEAREGIKTCWDTPIWIWVSRIADFCTRKGTQLLHLRDIYHAGVIVEYLFVYKNLAILDTAKFKWAYLSEFLFPWRASKYMLESKRKSLRKWKKIWSWATSFWSFCNFKKYAIYIFYIYALRDYSRWWSCPTSKKKISENSLVYMLYIWHSGSYHETNPTNDIFDHFYARISHFLSFLPKCAQKKGMIWMVDITFFVFVVSRDWRYMLEGYYYTFKKINFFLKLPNFSRTCTPLKIENHEKKFCFSWFSILRGVQVLLKLVNFKKKFFFESIIVTL